MKQTASGGYYMKRSIIIYSNFSSFVGFLPQNSCLYGSPSVYRGFLVFFPCIHGQLVHKLHVKFADILCAIWCGR
jgi:hypothetical protein